MNHPQSVSINETPIAFTMKLPGEGFDRHFLYYQQHQIIETEHTVMTDAGQSQVMQLLCKANDTDPVKKTVWDGTGYMRNQFDTRVNGNQPQQPPHQPQQPPQQHQPQHQPNPFTPQPEPIMDPSIEVDLDTFLNMQVLQRTTDFVMRFLVSTLRRTLDPESEDMRFVDEQMQEYNRALAKIDGVPDGFDTLPPITPETNDEEIAHE